MGELIQTPPPRYVVLQEGNPNLSLLNGTSLVGYITVSYDDLVALFGPPLSGDGYKTQAEWVLVHEGIVATIYDWKESVRPENVTEWHVGGHDSDALSFVNSLLFGI